ncbi:MAG: beta-lactamase family protein [Cyanobacteria bacterium K_Offshore_surface_m2_011]|nr:beta-lactamase family protein [Cyanobacteria bacterium K_Offshore_surface_m2_011]
MRARLAPVPLAVLGLQVVAAVPPAGAAPTAVPSASAPLPLEAMLEPVRTRYGLPALAAAVVIQGKVVAVGAVGTRRAGAQIPVERTDRFHLGSDTKAMTALLAAMAVEEGKLRWTSTLAEVFPELAAQMAPGLGGVTLVQFLSHTSGIPSDNAAFLALLQQSNGENGNLNDLRYWLLGEFVKQPLAIRPGTRFAYANMNYMVAGAMLERVSGRTWEELLTERVFRPLQLESAGFGPQASLGKIDAPLGHLVVGGQLKAMLAGPNGDNPLIIGPAGTAHMSVLDFARWAGWNAGEGRRGPALVRPATLKKLHTPVVAIPSAPNGGPGTPAQGKYGLGWAEVTVSWAPGRLLQHTGSNEMNLAHIWLEPRRDLGMVVLTNRGDGKAHAALLTVAQQLYGRFAGPVPLSHGQPAGRPAS